MAKRTVRRNARVIRQNRPGWRKKVLGRKVFTNKYHRTGNKIKSKEWVKT